MDSHSEDEKYVKIRQTVKRIILPLVQEIFNEDPTDIISFCSSYFDRILKNRENVEKNTDNLNSKYAGEISCKNEEGGVVKTTEKVSEMGATSPNIQGSASEPTLGSDKHSEGLSLRETSSWNLTSNSSRSAGSGAFLSFNIADAMSRIGDQPSSTAEKLETLKCEVKSGDANNRDAIQKEEEKSPGNENLPENETSDQIMYETEANRVQNTHVLPSAPSEENFEEELSKKKELDNSHIREDLNRENMNQTLNIQEGNTNEASENLKMDISSCSTAGQNCISVEESKVSIKPLSSNSSFGFVPHLSAYDEESKEELRGVDSGCSDDLNSKRKSSGEMKELSKRVSETLQNLAQEFSSAESNFNEQIQNVKEISDVLEGRHDTKISEHSKLTQGAGKDNKTDNSGKKRNENSNFDGGNFYEARDGNNELVNSISNPEFEPKFKKSPDNSLTKSSDSKPSDGSKRVSFQDVKYENGQETVNGPPDFEDCEIKQHQLNNEQNDSILRQDDRKDDDRPDNYESHQTVDESWIRRWYQAHPELDFALHQGVPRVFRSHHVFNANRRTENLHNIGEAGDVPPDRFYTAEEASNENLGHSLESTHMVRPSLKGEESNSFGSLSADEIHRRNTARATRNFADRDLTRTSHISQNIPYSWRQMFKPQACSLESEEKRLKQTQTKENEEIPASENETKQLLKSNATETPEILSEVIVVKKEEKAKIESLKDCQSTSSNETGGNKKETNIYNSAKNYTEYIKRVNQPSETDNEILSKFPLHQRKGSTQDCPEDGRNENPSKFHQQPISDGSCVKKVVNDYEDSSCTNKVCESQPTESCEKMEPGLNSAGGDFTASVTNENNSQTLNLHSSNEVREESNGNIEQNQAPASGITAESSEEIIIIDEQDEDFIDSCETLNFSSYSESDKSSDYSETDDFSLNSSV